MRNHEHADHLPSILSFEIYHSTPGIPILVEWKGGHFEVYCQGVGWPLRVPSPAPEVWEHFWKEIDGLGVWRWGNYQSEEILDGSMWGLRIAWGSMNVESSGHMSYPGQSRTKMTRSAKFNKFTRALENLVGLHAKL